MEALRPNGRPGFDSLAGEEIFILTAFRSPVQFIPVYSLE
jgi:hypothetical protein